MRHIGSRGNRSVAVDSLEPRQFLSAGGSTEIIGEPIIIGTSTLKDITFMADNGRKTTISVHDAQAAITFSGTNVPLLLDKHGYFPNSSVETVDSILVTNAIPYQATLTEVGAYGFGALGVGSITGGDLNTINMPDVNLTGSLTLNSVKRLTLAATSGATINIAKSVSAMKITGILNGILNTGSIGSLSAYEIMQAEITTNASYSRTALEIGSVTASYGIQESSIISAGNIGSVTAGFVQNSVITSAANLAPATAGTYPTEQVPESSSVFTEAGLIKSIRILDNTPGYFFSNSVVAARTIQSASIGQITGGGGIAAHSLGSLSAVGPSGQLDSITFRMGPKSLHTSSTLREALTKLEVPFSQGTGLQDNTDFYDFDLNILR